MGCSGLLLLGFVLNVAHCLEILDRDPNLEIPYNLTAVLGEDAYLSCRYLGEKEIERAQWKRQIKSKRLRLAGFSNGEPFSRDDFSNPASLTNLTVKMKVSSVEVEGQYICEFETEEEGFSESLFLTVVARPDVQILVNAETINGSHYQSVSCSAVGGRPVPQISWLVDGRPPSDYPYTVNVSETTHSNGTSTLSSILRFPTHLQEEDSVICLVQHPTLPNPKLTTARVETYTRPNVTMKAEMVQRGGSEFWVVSCISSGGRPDTDISLALNTDEEPQREYSTDTDTQTSSFLLPATVYEGRNVTCVFGHPKFTHKVSRVIKLPSFYLSGELGSNRDDFQDPESLELQEGQSDTVISLQVTGNVPHYNVTCKKDDGPLPKGVELVGSSSLTVQGPVEHQHAGLYECVFSYHQLNATLKFNVTVKPHVTQPVPPTVRVDLQTEDGYRVIECSAADAVPAANMSWLLPEGVSGVSWFNFTSHNGSHSVKGVLLLPACTPLELTAECVINHPAFEEPVNRSITLPLCARPHIAINSSTEWKDGDEYTKVDCSVDSVAPAATITWHAGNGDSISSVHVSLSEMEVQADGLVSARSSAHFLSSLYSGQNVTCRVEHPSLEAPAKRTIHIVVHKAPVLNVSVVRQEDSHLWLAVCDCRGEGVGNNLAWVLPENAKGQTSLHSTYEGRVIKARLTYQFPLAYHEGQDLTCVYHFGNGATEKKTIHIPRYYISAVRVLNHTTPLQSRYSGETIAHRLSLQENHHNQRVLLRVEGNVPEYIINCRRSDGSFVQMDGVAMVFQPALTEQEEGLYTCQASFYHHTATVNIQVEVASKDKHFVLAAMICAFSALAILVILAVTLWVCCKVNGRTQYKKQESLSALTSLMQEPGSPGVKKPAVTENDKKEYAQLISYSIVIDVKSTV
ncbi:synaptogenesis protein syg-2 isoform X2 [Sander lucioperca]|uniref:synaptogenesis protein syg-2 isoform X2 n=1 Tax=Sander lucioperca TaxID=283035 RepID=UPI00125D1D47|nr:synaptogenesis protein syg-2 isoform X2 [Sander lucioperca]